MPSIYADLHLHTVLSACAEVEMLPPLIVQRAQQLGLGLIAVTDHNCAANCSAVSQAAEGTGLRVLPGMELQTAEEVHMLCLFETLEQALTWQGIVFDHLPHLPNREDVFGGQYVVDRNGDYVRTEERRLALSCDLSLDQAVRRVLALGGLPIPSHIDRQVNSLLANLGFVPVDLAAPALEVNGRTDPDELIARQPDVARYPLVRNGDAHRLGEMRRGIVFEAAEASFDALAHALRHRRHRIVTG